MVDHRLFNSIYRKKKVLITGNTGFKGSWLSLWLNELGAEVMGISLKEEGHDYSHFENLKLPIETKFIDILDFEKINKVISEFKPDILFHLAAQPIVKVAMEKPIKTFETNLIGTINIFESCRLNNINKIINVTSDKVYMNQEKKSIFNEKDIIGGNDLYSASKACVEIMSDSYRKVFKSHNSKIVNLRSGNVIGGGDYGQYRLIPDIVKSYMTSKRLQLRNPNSVRPWQHVLSIVSGYLVVGQKLLEGGNFSSFNFGPLQNEVYSVDKILKEFQKTWKTLKPLKSNENFYESNYLMIDSSKAREILNWDSVWDFNTSIRKTVQWYDSYINYGKIISKEQLIDFIKSATDKNLTWTQR